MPDPGAPEIVRLSLPPDPDLRLVAEVAVAALVRRSGRSDDAVQSARRAVHDCVAEVVEAGEGRQLEIEITVAEARLAVRVVAGGVERSITIPGPPTPPG